MIYNFFIMQVSARNKVIKGKSDDAYTVSFTDDAKQQIDELRKFFKAKNATETIMLAISWLQRAKDLEEKKSLNPHDSK